MSPLRRGPNWGYAIRFHMKGMGWHSEGLMAKNKSDAENEAEDEFNRDPNISELELHKADVTGRADEDSSTIRKWSR